MEEGIKEVAVLLAGDGWGLEKKEQKIEMRVSHDC